MELLSLRSVSLLAFGVCALSASASVGGYKLTDLGFPGGGGATGINSFGQVALTAGNGPFNTRAYEYSGGVSTLLGPSNLGSSAYEINDSGVVAGSIQVAPNGASHGALFSGGSVIDLAGTGAAFAISNNGKVTGVGNGQAFLYSGGTTTYLGALPGGSLSTGYDVNNAGTVVGYAETKYGGNTYYHAMSSTGGVMTDLGTLGSTSPGYGSVARGINNSGTIVGYYTSPTYSGGNGFYYSGGVMHALTGLYTLGCSAEAINDVGRIVGTSTVLSGQRAVIYDGGVAVDLNKKVVPSTATGWTLRWAYDINNKGQIVGLGEYGGQYRAFLLTPVPEPGTWAALCLGAVALMRRRRKA